MDETPRKPRTFVVGVTGGSVTAVGVVDDTGCVVGSTGCVVGDVAGCAVGDEAGGSVSDGETGDGVGVSAGSSEGATGCYIRVFAKGAWGVSGRVPSERPGIGSKTAVGTGSRTCVEGRVRASGRAHRLYWADGA